MQQQSLSTTSTSQSQPSQPSLDSSILSESQAEDTQSTKTLSIGDRKQSDKMMGEEMKMKEMVRFGEGKRDSGVFGDWEGMFVGFVGFGKGGEMAVKVDQGLLKKAEKFMAIGESQFVKSSPQLDCYRTTSPEQANENMKEQNLQTKSNQNYGQKFEQFDFSCGFKSLGSGTTIQISQAATNKVKQLFKDLQTSQKKPTKQKLPNIPEIPPSDFSPNFIKTYKPKIPIKSTPLLKKSVASSGVKIIQNLSNRWTENCVRICLKDLGDVGWGDVREFGEYWRKEGKGKGMGMGEYRGEHFGGCGNGWCYFCEKYREEPVIVTKEFLEKEIERLLTLKQSTKQRIPKLIDLIIFKLSRYQYFNPSLQSHQLTPNNILLSLHKKCLAYQKDLVPPLQQSLTSLLSSRGKNLGRQLILVVVNIALSTQSNNYFVELSDGWSTVQAVVSERNLLYRFVGLKIVCGSKIWVVNWGVHPVQNILEGHPDRGVAESGGVCIEISYNNTMPVSYWAKLGYPKQPFYRPVQKCKESGGTIPLVQGIIIRMFTIKSHKNTTINYLQILLAQGHCILMKVALAEQVSLVQLFRLYSCYHFYRVKKISNSLLQFSGNSKFYDIDDKQNPHRQKIQQLLKQRLLNLNPTNSLPAPTCPQIPKKLYLDLITKTSQIHLLGKPLSIEQKIDGTVLLQQYTLTQNNEGYVLSKGDRGSCLRRIPKIYDNIQYTIF